MPIAVICPGCKAQFRVSDKFAGKEGPCPKCKAKIKIPVVDEITIHAPETAPQQPGAPAAPGATPRPIRRKRFEIPALGATIAIGGALLVVVVAALAGRFFRENFFPTAAALVAISIPICAGGYATLRDDELEPFRGTSLWIRAAICGAIYAGLWWGFALLPESLFANNWNWLFIPVPFVLVGTFAAFLAFELSPENSFFHYAFYLLATIVLRALIGLPALWNLAPETTRTPFGS